MGIEKKRDASLPSLCKQMMGWCLWQRQQCEGRHEATSFDHRRQGLWVAVVPLASEGLVGKGVHGHPLHLVPPMIRLPAL